MNYFCDIKVIWQDDDFSPCFHLLIINSVLLFSILVGSFLLLIIKFIQYKRISSLKFTQNNEKQFQTESIEDQPSTIGLSRKKIRFLWPQYNWLRFLICTGQCVLYSILFYYICHDLYHWNNLVEGTQIINSLFNYSTRFFYWVYSLMILIVSGFYRNVSFSKLVVKHLNTTSFIVFILSLLDIRSYYLVLESDILASTGYLFNIISMCLTFLLLIIIINESPFTSSMDPTTSDKKVFTEEYATIFSKFTFIWVNAIMKKGWKKTLNNDDLLELSKENLTINILASYAKKRAEKKKSISSSLFYTFQLLLGIQFFYSMIWSLATFGSPFFLSKIIQFLENNNNNNNNNDNPAYQVSISSAFLFVFGLFLSCLIETFSSQQSYHIGRILSLRVQSIFISEVYGKSLRRRDNTNSNDPIKNEIIINNNNKHENANNLVSVDAQKLSEATAYIFYFYSFPVQATICILFLYKLLGVSSLCGVLIMFLSQLVMYYFSRRLEHIHQRCMRFTDQRIKLTNEVLNGIRMIKFFAWEQEFRQKILAIRNEELKTIQSRFYMMIILRNTGYVIPVLIILIVFYVYTSTNTLTTSTAFTAIALFNILKAIFEEFPNLISYFIQARVSLHRLGQYLKEDEVDDVNSFNYHHHHLYLPPPSLPTTITMNATVIGFVDNANFSWTQPTMDEQGNITSLPHIQNLNISFPLNKLSIVCGPTGSGKSTLIASLLGETYCLSGRALLPRGSLTNKLTGGGIAYVAQSSWIQNMSIKDNILFGLPYHAERYNKILYMTALTRDLEILEHGDDTEIGEKGITLSGGQKQRIAIARAIYSQAEIIILDDCLSAVDTYTAKHIYEQCLKGEYMKNKTIILVTHHVGLCLCEADYVVCLKDGKVSSAGPANDVIHTGALNEEGYHLSTENGSDEIAELNPIPAPFCMKAKDDDHGNDNQQSRLIKNEKSAEGNVQNSTYQAYMRSSGGYLFWIAALFIFCCFQCTSFGQDYLIKTWVAAYKNDDDPSLTSDDTTHVNITYYAGMYFMVGMIALLFASLRFFIIFTGSVHASRNYHIKLLDCILNATIRFFDTTPLGRIMNRFSLDMETVDQLIASEVSLLIHNVLASVFVILLAITITPLFIIYAAMLAIVFWFVGRYYLCTSRDLKRLHSVSKSPIYAQLNESVHGVTTIRAFGATERFMGDLFKKIDCSNKGYFWMWSCNRWLQICIETLGSSVGFCTGLLLIFSTSLIDVGLAGLLLTYTLSFTRQMTWIIRRCAANELNFISLERIEDYINTVKSEIIKMPSSSSSPSNNEIHPQWPSHGNIDVKNLTIRYAPNLPSVIHDISFQIKSGEKIGIVGKTGSGKSSLVLAFFRFMSSIDGSIVIDDVNIGQISLYNLRCRLTIIAQDPILFSGTIRSNLDPFGQHDDALLWSALKQSHFIDVDEQQKDHQINVDAKQMITLDSPVTENGSNYSQGQRQLIALARALVKKSALVILDEATASVDFDTDRRIQNTIRSEFGKSTLLTVAHRLNTIIDYDRVLVLDQGKIIEFDSPYHLMTKEYGYFKMMCEKSGEYDNLLTMAKSKHIA